MNEGAEFFLVAFVIMSTTGHIVVSVLLWLMQRDVNRVVNDRLDLHADHISRCMKRPLDEDDLGPDDFAGLDEPEF